MVNTKPYPHKPSGELVRRTTYAAEWSASTFIASDPSRCVEAGKRTSHVSSAVMTIMTEDSIACEYCAAALEGAQACSARRLIKPGAVHGAQMQHSWFCT